MGTRERSDCQLTQMPNGIRVVSERAPHAHSVAIGVWLDTGSRAESDSEAGISHFIEHLLFKGTLRRTARQIAEEFDAIGGQVDAFTDKECTCYYCKVLPEHLNTGLDILADMLRNPALDPAELEREKNVILEEIKAHQDSEEDLVHDLFARTLWPDHPLGRPVLGRPEVIASATRDQVAGQLRDRYVPGRMVVSAAGDVLHADLIGSCERLLGDLDGAGTTDAASEPDVRLEAVRLSRPGEQVHFCMGTRGLSQLHDDRYALAVVDTAVGGGMSSRLFQEVRENRGLCYSIGSYTAAYREGGLFAVYAATSPDRLDEVRDLARDELKSVARSGLQPEELLRSKNQIRGGMLLGLDSMTGRMTRLGRNLLYFDRIVPVSEVLARIDAVTAADARRVAAELFTGNRFAEAAVGPFNGEGLKEEE